MVIVIADHEGEEGGGDPGVELRAYICIYHIYIYI